MCALCAATKAAATAAAVVGTKIAVCDEMRSDDPTCNNDMVHIWSVGRPVDFHSITHTTQNTLARQMPAQCYNIKGLFVIGYLKGSDWG